MAKTERACHPDTRLQEVTLKALAPFVGPDLSTDANNCVVCAVKICHAPRLSAAAGNAFLSSISRTTMTRLRHLRSRCGWSRQFAMSMNIRRTRLHVSTMSRATIFVLSPLAGTPYRKSPPETSCAPHSGSLTTLSRRSTSSTSL